MINFPGLKLKIALLAVALSMPVPALATTIVDTGTPTGPLSWMFSDDQYFAGEFTLSQSTTLISVEAFFSNAGDAGTVTVEIWSDGGNIPGASLFSTAVAMASGAALDWYGASGLTWLLGPGTYWAAFIPDSNISGNMPSIAPSPLDEYAQASSTGGWENRGADFFDYLDIGMRIEGNAVVPLPAALPLFAGGLSLLGLIGWRRKRMAAAAT